MNLEQAKQYIGRQVRVSDGTPRPPERFKKKVREWESCNYSGTLERSGESGFYKCGYEAEVKKYETSIMSVSDVVPLNSVTGLLV